MYISSLEHNDKVIEAASNLLDLGSYAKVLRDEILYLRAELAAADKLISESDL
jgi:hypothetical protein